MAASNSTEKLALVSPDLSARGSSGGYDALKETQPEFPSSYKAGGVGTLLPFNLA